ncbi:MAG: hypothetical protein R3A80_03875 [Bdellovibrionota bacterium]
MSNFIKLSVAFLSISLVSCNSSGGSVSNTGTAGITNSNMVTTVEGAFESLGDTDFGSSTRRLSRSLASRNLKTSAFFSAEAESEEDPDCSNKGRPWDVTANGGLGDVLSDQDEYSSRLFRCVATINSESPETIRGSLIQAEEISCLVEALGLSYPTAEGSEVHPFSNLNLASTNCFADLSEMPSVVSGNLTLSKLDTASTGYEEKFQVDIDDIDGLTVGDQPFTYVMYFFNEDNRMGFKAVEQAEGMNGAGGITQVTLDFNEGTIAYNSVDDRDRSSDDYRRSVRLMLKATFDSNFNITDVSEGAGIYTQSGPTKDTQFSLYSIRGNSTNGYKSFGYNYTDSVRAVSFTEMGSNCIDSTDDCTSEAGLVANSSSAESFYLNNQTAWETLASSGKSVCYSSVNYTATPNTGVLGVCDD